MSCPAYLNALLYHAGDLDIIAKFSRKTLVEKYSSIPLATYNRVEREMIVNPDAINMLQKICKPVAVLGICGPYRSGKSYFGSVFMRSDDFRVTHKIDPCTKGIWISTSILESEEFAIIFLDTEGIKAEHANEEAMKYLIITTLLCSYLIYNLRGLGILAKENLYQLRYVFNCII